MTTRAVSAEVLQASAKFGLNLTLHFSQPVTSLLCHSSCSPWSSSDRASPTANSLVAEYRELKSLSRFPTDYLGQERKHEAWTIDLKHGKQGDSLLGLSLCAHQSLPVVYVHKVHAQCCFLSPWLYLFSPLRPECLLYPSSHPQQFPAIYSSFGS